MDNTEGDSTREEIELAESIINKVLDLFDVTGNIEIRRRREGTILDIQGCSNPGRLIGEEGSTLSAIQLLATIILCRRTQKPTKVVIDVNGYRRRRRRQLEDMARRALDDVNRTGRRVTLKPMNAADRRIVHMTLSGREEVETYSINEDPDTGRKCVQVSPRDVEEFEDVGDYDEEYPDSENVEYDGDEESSDSP